MRYDVLVLPGTIPRCKGEIRLVRVPVEAG